MRRQYVPRDFTVERLPDLPKEPIVVAIDNDVAYKKILKLKWKDKLI